MMGHIKKLVVNILTLLAVAVGCLLVAVGYSDHVPPTVHPWVGCAGMIMPAVVVLNVAMLLVLLSVRWRRAWIPLAAFAAAYMPIRTFMPLHLPVEEAETHGDSVVRLMTYNVNCYSGNHKYDHGFDTIAAYVMAHDIDVLCLQEEHGKDKFLDRWHEYFPYNDTLSVSGNVKGMINVLGIHTRLPILRRERIAYESSTNGSVAYHLLYGSDTIIVINNHLEGTHLTAEDRNSYSEILRGKRERQEAEEELLTLVDKLGESMVKRVPEAEAVHRYVESHRQYPVIVCGDFNDTPISYVRRIVAKGLTDCFAEAGCGLGLSYNRKGFNFRIDHIFCNSDFTPIHCKVDDKMDASDHYPMICSMKMNNKP